MSRTHWLGMMNGVPLIEPLCPPCQVFVYISLQIRVRAPWKNMTFLSHEFGKGQCTFYPVKLNRFAKKEIMFVGNIKISWGGTITNQVKRLFDKQKFQKSNFFLEGSGHPNFTNPFEYYKSLQGKSFSKRIGALTPPNRKIFRGGTMCPPLDPWYIKIGWAK